MKNLFGFLILVIGLGSITAQSYNKLYKTLPNNAQNLSSSDTLKILAVMVEFQTDKYDATIGTGKFGSHYTQTYGDTILDPLPHNADYFADHLLFAKNYFNKVSNGKLNIAYKVLPEVITVSQTMREYVPGYKSQNLTPLGKFSEEVWKLADQKFSNVKFSDYDLFIIFHAGVSSGLDLGTFSVDRNMPSLYLSNTSLKAIFGSNFSGFSTKTGSVKNTLIMPETESREQTYIDNSVGLVQVTINGGLVANIGSHLGLPDLFDTETGKSAIGRFGLMDGQAIVANNGMFPPELSPWEKMFLGWEQPKEISEFSGKQFVSARQIALPTETTLLKVPISSKEYFLVENRQQDAKKDELILTIKKGSQIYKKTIQKDTSGLFNIQPTDIKGGVVVDVDEFDAAVPGNGIVIWHIDENIINSTIAENKINADLNKKGVDVEEADGIQDIGETFSSVFGDFIGEGDKYDFWYKGNKAKLYKNIFSPDSKPNTKTNDGANTLITLDEFSESANTMSFFVHKEAGGIKLISSNEQNFGVGGRFLAANQYSTNSHVVLLNNSDLYVYDLMGQLVHTQTKFSDIQPLVINQSNSFYVIGYKKQYGINVYRWKGNNYYELKTVRFGSQDNVVLNCSISDKDTTLFIGIAGSYTPWDSNVFMISLSRLMTLNTTFPNAFPREFDFYTFNEKVIGLANDGSRLTVFSETKVYEFDITTKMLLSQVTVSPGIIFGVATYDTNNKKVAVALTQSNRVAVTNNGNLVSNFSIPSNNAVENFVIGDIFSDGQNYVLYKDANKIHAYNFQGVIANNFPIELPVSENIYGNISLIDYNNDKKLDIVLQTENGKTYFITPDQKKITYSAPIVSNSSSDPKFITSIFNTSEGKSIPYLITVDQAKLAIYQISTIAGESVWSNTLSNEYNNLLVRSPFINNSGTDFFPTAKAYNWPNPVYGSSTKIRYYVSENSTATVKIFDLAGELVTTLTGNAVGGMDNEIEWEVGKIQSGVYYANLEVVGAGGKSANKIIKIAVIK